MTLVAYASTGSLTDPPGASAIAASVEWLQATLLGTAATVIATLAVASIGLMMLAGRLNVRHGLTVIAGCFILFGARSIVAGIQSGVAAGEAVEAPAATPSPFADLVAAGAARRQAGPLCGGGGAGGGGVALFLKVHPLAPVAALGHVIRQARQDEAREAEHGRRLWMAGIK